MRNGDAAGIGEGLPGIKCLTSSIAQSYECWSFGKRNERCAGKLAGWFTSGFEWCGQRCR